MIDPQPWVNRPHPGPRAKRLPITPEQREAVEAALRPGKTEQRIAKRAQALLLMAEGVGNGDIAMLVGVHVRTVEKWKARFTGTDDPVARLADAPRSGRPPSLSRTLMLRASRPKPVGLRRTSASR